MLENIIKVTELSKKFSVGIHKSGSLRESLMHRLNMITGNKNKVSEEFWALNDISFNVKQGDVLGIIGKNGAGKSTLLKILSRITDPTKGKVEINGRVASLLEVGTGFHQELTGRENVFLNGTILGMTKSEIRKKFDEIIDFSGIEKFIDTPVKRYSSGMAVRLAFAVAAHLEPEILLIDEVLSVGDAEFQRKSLGKMDDISKKEGRTVLFVSHNMPAIKALCSRAMYINNGEINYLGQVHETIRNYLESTDFENTNEFDLTNCKRAAGKGNLTFTRVTFNKNLFTPSDDIEIKLKLKNHTSEKDFKELKIAIHVVDYFENYVYHLNTKFLSDKNIVHNDNQVYCFKLKKNSLKKGDYRITFRVFANGYEEDFITTGVVIRIDEGNIYNYPNSSDIGGMIQSEFDFYISDGKE